MNSTRDDILSTIKSNEATLLKVANDMVIAGSATACTQPTRMLSTYSCFYINPFDTFKNALPNVFNGALINVMRGASMTGIQLFAKDIGHEKAGFLGAILYASFSGAAIASVLETALIRKSLNANSYLHFSLPIFFLYTLREATVSMSVLVKNNLSQRQKDALLVLSGTTTAGLQKFITVAAAKDTLKKGITAPDFAQGIANTIYKMANGAYNHPAFQVPFPTPQSSIKKCANVFYQLSGGPNVIAFRVIHLFAFREALAYASNNFTLNHAQGFFNNKLKKTAGALQEYVNTNKPNK